MVEYCYRLWWFWDTDNKINDNEGRAVRVNCKRKRSHVDQSNLELCNKFLYARHFDYFKASVELNLLHGLFLPQRCAGCGGHCASRPGTVSHGGRIKLHCQLVSGALSPWGVVARAQRSWGTL